MTSKFTETVATWADGRATTFRLDAGRVRAAYTPEAPLMSAACRRYAAALEECAAIMDKCAASLRDTTPMRCAICRTVSPKNEPCTGCGAA